MTKRLGKKKGKVGRVIWGIVGGLLLVLVLFVTVNAVRNVKAMNNSIA